MGISERSRRQTLANQSDDTMLVRERDDKGDNELLVRKGGDNQRADPTGEWLPGHLVGSDRREGGAGREHPMRETWCNLSLLIVASSKRLAGKKRVNTVQ